MNRKISRLKRCCLALLLSAVISPLAAHAEGDLCKDNTPFEPIKIGKLTIYLYDWTRCLNFLCPQGGGCFAGPLRCFCPRPGVASEAVSEDLGQELNGKTIDEVLEIVGGL